jgi:type 1 glutamine amidotransferase
MNHARLTAATILVLLTAFVASAQDNPNWPNGYATVSDLARGEGGGGWPTLSLTQGQPITFPGIDAPMDKAFADDKAVVVQVAGLESGVQYVLALTWWDADDKGRTQSIYMGPSADSMKCVLPSTPAKAFFADKSTWATMMLPVDSAMVNDGKCLLEIRHESGPSAVFSKIQILQRTDKTPQKRILIVTGDDYPGHRWRETAPELASALRKDPRLEVSITEIPAILGSPLLRNYDAVMIHFKNYSERLPLGEPVWNGLRDYMNNGGGLLIAHFGCGAFQEWNDFVQFSGRVWNPKFRGHDPYGPFDVSIVDHDHAVTKGLPDFPTTDELYTCLDGSTPMHVLCTAVSKVDKQTYPMGFVLEPGKGRVFHCTLGHDVKALQSEGTRALYLRAAQWAVGLPAN